jgi:tight adherence protein B
MSTLILALVFFGTLLLLVGTYVLVNRRQLQAADAVRARLGDSSEETINIFRDQSVSGLALLNRLLTGRSITEQLQRELRRAGSTRNVGEFVLVVTLCSGVGFLLGERMGGGVFGIVLAALAGAAPWQYLKRRQAKRVGKLEEQLPDAIDMLVNALKAGYSIQAAMEFVGREIPQPLGPEFTRFYEEQRLGMDARAALGRLLERVGTTDMRMFVTALLIQRETGGNLGEVLGKLAVMMRERVTFRGHLQTLTAEPKMSARLLTTLPVFMFLVLMAINGAYERTLWTAPGGRFVLAYGVCSVAVGYLILKKIAHIEI